jgi:hypothetical protein
MPFVNAGTFSFVLKGNKGRKVFGAHARGELTIKGSFHMQGLQPIDDDSGAPVWVADFFDNNQDIDQIALSGKDHSVVYARIQNDT